MNKNVASNLPSEGSIEQDYIVKCEKLQFWRCLIKISISVLNFSIESVKKPTVYDLLHLIAIYSPKNDNKDPSEMRN